MCCVLQLDTHHCRHINSPPCLLAYGRPCLLHRPRFERVRRATGSGSDRDAPFTSPRNRSSRVLEAVALALTARAAGVRGYRSLPSTPPRGLCTPAALRIAIHCSASGFAAAVRGRVGWTKPKSRARSPTWCHPCEGRRPRAACACLLVGTYFSYYHSCAQTSAWSVGKITVVSRARFPNG
eukprot:6186851-Pleurochrysis_carterae.AAC.5